MRVRSTDIGNPLFGPTWEYSRASKSASPFHMAPDQKLKVFVSSACGKPKYDTIRAELKSLIEATSLADVYLFEAKGASTLPAGEHYIRALEDSDICIFLIDNADGVSSGVQAEIDVVKKKNIKALYYFCDENSTEKTALEQSLIGASHAKSKTVHKFSDLSRDSANDLINDVITIYHYYCEGKIVSKREDESEEFQPVNIADIENLQRPTISKTVLDNVDKCKNYILELVTGQSYPKFQDETVKSNEIDDWCAQFLSVLFEGKSIKNFNTGMFLGVLKNQQSDEFHRITQIRWQAIQAYFLGDVEKCLEHLENALEYAKETNQPTWVTKDILIDLRNLHQIQETINNCFSESFAQKELTDSNEELYYPILDRINNSLHEKYIEDLFKEKTKSPYSITFGDGVDRYTKLLASTYVVSMYNGSLTYITLFCSKIKYFMFFLCLKYDNWNFRRDMLKFAIYEGNKKEIEEILNSYPEILDNLSAPDAEMIIRFCENQPLKYKRFASQLLAFGAVGYYLPDKDFEKFEAYIINEIKIWLETPNPVLGIGQNIFYCLSGISYRMSQDTLSEICCLFIDKGYSRWFTDVFNLIAARVDLRNMSKDSAATLIQHIIKIFDDDKRCQIIGYAPRFLYMLRCQDRDLTQELDKKVSESFPKFYNCDYKLETMGDNYQDIAEFLQHYVELIKDSNAKQGKNGVYYGFGKRYIAIIRSILLLNNHKYSVEIMDSIITAAVDTLVVSKESISTKLDAISLLSCIVLRYTDDYMRNRHIFEEIVDKQEELEVSNHGLLISNIDGVSLKICLQFLFSAMGMDTYAEILELMPYIQNDIPTTISVSRVIMEYLEAADEMYLSPKLESVVLQNVLQWLCSEQLDIRWNATKVLLGMSNSPENKKIINNQLISRVDSDNYYIKNLIMRNIYKVDVVTEKTRDYIVSKLENDSCFLVRKFCQEIVEQHTQK